MSNRWNTILFIIIASVCIYQVVIPPIIGVADNGDFIRLILQKGIAFPEGNSYFSFINSYYELKQVPVNVKLFSSTLLLIDAGLLLCKWISKTGMFDIRYMGVLYVALFIIFVWMVLRYVQHQSGKVIVGFLVLFILCDVGYVSYFNSFYSEPTSFVFFLLAFVFFLYMIQKNQLNYLWFSLFLFSIIMFIASKTQNVSVGLLISIIMFRMTALLENRKEKLISLGSGILIVAASISMLIMSPPAFKEANTYNSVFTGIVKYSDSPENDLNELGVDPGYAVLKGTHIFQNNHPIDIASPAFRENFFGNVSQVDILKFYATHPGRMLDILNENKRVLFDLRPDYLGNFSKESGVKPGTQSHAFEIWSNLRISLFSKSLSVVFVFYLFYFVILMIVWRKSRMRLVVEWFILVGVLAVAQLITVILGDGTFELAKHLFLFNFLLDLSICILISMVAMLFVRKERIKEG